MISDYCDIAFKIGSKKGESDTWTIEHGRDVDNHNQRYKSQCTKKEWWQFWGRV